MRSIGTHLGGRRSAAVAAVMTVFVVVALVSCGSGPRAARNAAALPSGPSQATTRSAPGAASASPLPSAPRSSRPSPTASPTLTKPVSTPPVGGQDNRVYVLGDSVLLGTVRTLPAALTGWRVTMDCVGSRRLPQGIEDLRAKRSRIGSVVVIQMGNDYIPGEDGTFSSQIDRAMRVLVGVRRVVWVTVAEKWPSRVGINRAIRAAAARWPEIRIADWAPIVAAHPPYAYDQLHLTPTGRVAISRLIAGLVGAAPRTAL